MKNLRKALAAVMALAVMSVSATAFAEVSATGAFSGGNSAVTADYSEIAQNKVKATVDTTLATPGTQMTFLVLDDGTDVTNIGESDILYIDQKELTVGGNTFTGVINLARVAGAAQDATELPEGSYPIRVGYYYDNDGVQTFGLAAATMVVTAGSEDEPATITIIWGDVNTNGAANIADATDIVDAIAGVTTTWEKEIDGVTYTFTFNSSVVAVDGTEKTMSKNDSTIVWADVNANGAANIADATDIVDAIAGVTTTWLDDAVTFNTDAILTLVDAE